MSELPENASPPPENPLAELIAAITDRIRRDLKALWLADMAIEAVLAGGLAAVARLPLRELLLSQMAALDEQRKVIESFLMGEGCKANEAEERADAALVKVIAVIANGQVLYNPKAFTFQTARNYNIEENKKRAREGHLEPEAEASAARTRHGLRPEVEANYNKLEGIYEKQAEQRKSREKEFRNGLDEEEKRLLELLQKRSTSLDIAQATGWNEKKVQAVLKRLQRKAARHGVTIPGVSRRKGP